MNSEGEILAFFKSREFNRPIQDLTNRSKLAAVLEAWPRTAVRRTGIARRPPATRSEGALWSFLWDGVDVALGDLAELAGITRGEAETLFNEARARKLIYPDGTIHAGAKRELDGRPEK